MSKRVGLYKKYQVERTDGSSGPGGKHEHCAYFVLDIEHDPHALAAMLAYADSCKESLPELAKDIRKVVPERCGCRGIASCPHMEWSTPSQTASRIMKARGLGLGRIPTTTDDTPGDKTDLTCKRCGCTLTCTDMRILR